jgi:exopolysaccharide biosynthesis polyprenyl glycosylphosphotransferase
VSSVSPQERVQQLGPSYLQRRIRRVLTIVFAIDAVVLVATSVIAWRQRQVVDIWWDTPFDPTSYFPAVSIGVIILWAMLLIMLGAYHYRTFGSGFEEFRAITVASALTLGIVGFIGFLGQSTMSRGYPLLFFIFGTPALLVVRYIDRKVLHYIRKRGRLVHRVIAVGAPVAVAELVGVLNRESWTGYHVLGMCVPPAYLGAESSVVPMLGGLDDVRRVAIEHSVDTVLVAGGSYSSSADLRKLGWAIEGLHLDMLVVPSLTDVAGPRIHMRHVAGLPLVHVEEPQVDEAGGFGKRLFDIVVASILVALISPVMLLIALFIKVTDWGPVFYRQQRVGILGDDFVMVKFRSMVRNADQIRVSLEGENESDGVLFKIKNDPRITRVGRFIRKYSLDEIPQLFNVVRGEMSLVGPRPPLPDEVEKYDEVVHRRLLVRPGMTGLWQVSGRSDLSWEESVRLDLYYVDNWSLVSDLVIMLKTVRAVLFSSGAY